VKVHMTNKNATEFISHLFANGSIWSILLLHYIGQLKLVFKTFAKDYFILPYPSSGCYYHLRLRQHMKSVSDWTRSIKIASVFHSVLNLFSNHGHTG
jgi:hypothetical protein